MHGSELIQDEIPFRATEKLSRVSLGYFCLLPTCMSIAFPCSVLFANAVESPCYGRKFKSQSKLTFLLKVGDSSGPFILSSFI